MNEVEQLREAMRATEHSRDVLDLAVVLREGRRLRRRRRLAATGAAVLSVMAVVGAAAGVQLARPPEVAPTPYPAVTAPVAVPAATLTPADGVQEPRPVGEVVTSGIRYGTEERVFYMVPVDVPQQPGVTIGLVAGRRAADGRLTSDYLVNDVKGSDRHPGFHQIGYDSPGPTRTNPAVPTFGYFVGSAKRIIGTLGTVGGRQIDARLATWSADPRVVIFWFDPQDLPPGKPLDGIVARDAHGRKL